jgi:hypothetical protein
MSRRKFKLGDPIWLNNFPGVLYAGVFLRYLDHGVNVEIGVTRWYFVTPHNNKHPIITQPYNLIKRKPSKEPQVDFSDQNNFERLVMEYAES